MDTLEIICHWAALTSVPLVYYEKLKTVFRNCANNKFVFTIKQALSQLYIMWGI